MPAMAGVEKSAEETKRDGRVRGDLPCISCGYLLRGLPTGQDCPECGTPIEATTLQPLLQGSTREPWH